MDAIYNYSVGTSGVAQLLQVAALFVVAYIVLSLGKSLIDGIVAANLRFSVLSNGTLITPQMARLLAATRRCDYVQVSVDGSHAATHDSACGRGSFSRALDGLRALQAAGVTVAVLEPYPNGHQFGKSQHIAGIAEILRQGN